MKKTILFILFCGFFLTGIRNQEITPLTDGIVNNIHGNFSLSEAYPNPADFEFKLDYVLPPKTLKAKIIIRSLLGLIVSEKNIENRSGTITIQTNNLTSGFYFYSLMIDGNVAVSRKLIIKH